MFLEFVSPTVRKDMMKTDAGWIQ